MLFSCRFTKPSCKIANTCCRLALVLAFAAFLASPAQTQEYKSIPVPPDEPARKFAVNAKQCVRDPGRFAQERAQFEEFFKKVYFPTMTGTSPEELAKLGTLRYELFKSYLWATDNEQLQSSLTELAYTAMTGIIKPQTPQFHPAVQYNAIITLGMLDAQYSREGASPRPPKPLPKATKALTLVVDSATTDDPKFKNAFAPPVVLGAVIGLERHAQLRESLDAATVQAMTTALLKLIAQDQPSQSMDRNAYSWMRVRAASALATLGGVGQNNEVHDGLIKLIANSKSLDDRCATAALLKKIKYEGAKVDGAATANAIFALARDLADAESKTAKKFQDEQIGLGPGGVAGTGNIGFDGTVQERFPRRKVLDRLTDLRAGLEAVKPVVPPDAQAQVDVVMAAIDPVITAALDKNTVELKLTQAIGTMADAINRAVPAPQAAAVADATDEDAF
jgi:hypothetical protein